jgi:aldose 1-epimerase
LRASPLITIAAGRADVAVAPAIGGSIARFRWNVAGKAHDWLRPASDADFAASDAGRLACFPLVPFSNRIRNGRFTFDRRTIRLPRNAPPDPHSRHGHGYQAAWSVVERSADRLSIAHEHAADAWPFAYRAEQQFVVADDALTITLSVENASRQPMPAGLGLHPYFRATPACRLIARVAAMWATDDEVMPTALTAADPRLGSHDGMPIAGSALDNVFVGWQREATIVWPETRSRLVLEASTPLSFLVVYSPAAKDFFCAEPVSHCTDAFNLAAQGRTDTGMLTLQPGERVAATLRLRPSLD